MNLICIGIGVVGLLFFLFFQGKRFLRNRRAASDDKERMEFDYSVGFSFLSGLLSVILTGWAIYITLSDKDQYEILKQLKIANSNSKDQISEIVEINQSTRDNLIASTRSIDSLAEQITLMRIQNSTSSQILENVSQDLVANLTMLNRAQQMDVQAVKNDSFRIVNMSKMISRSLGKYGKISYTIDTSRINLDSLASDLRQSITIVLNLLLSQTGNEYGRSNPRVQQNLNLLIQFLLDLDTKIWFDHDRDEIPCRTRAGNLWGIVIALANTGFYLRFEPNSSLLQEPDSTQSLINREHDRCLPEKFRIAGKYYPGLPD